MIHIAAGANLLTRVMTDAATDGGKWMGFLEKLEGLRVLALVDEGDIDGFIKRAATKSEIVLPKLL